MSQRKGSSDVNFLSLLLLAFIILKVCGVIDWSWWLVFIPLWIQLTAIFVIAFIYGMNGKRL